ncbi:dsRBD fold-containing protein [Nonomuraea sp. NPDC048916]|uniref:dsRBD fold-containing protein n=1 Tax=Nonomuraea sp. NPDC048916 TaxID=3154232 RepID=UPI0033EAFD96
MNEKHWDVQIDISENDDTTTAQATLATPADAQLTGYGEAHRNPHDPPAAGIGDELAAARALEDLTRQLLGVADQDVVRNARSGSQMPLV